MNFILRMAWRDSRVSRRRLALVSLSVVLGIAALVGIASFGDNLARTIELQTKVLLGSDLSVTSPKPIPDAALAYFLTLGGEISREVSLSSMINFPSRANQRRLVQVRALDGNFPFYGKLVTHPVNAMGKVRTGNFALLDESLLVQFGVQVGDEVKIGKVAFVVAGALREVPGEPAAISMFSPRVYVSMRALEATELLKGVRFARYRVDFKLPPERDVEALAKELRTKFRGQRLQFDTVEERKQRLGENLKDLYSFLSMVGFIALFLGAVGVASAMHVYVRQKIATVAVLRCLGASARTSFAIYLTQGFFIGLLGALLGAALGVTVQLVLPAVIRDFLPFPVEFFVSWPAVAKGGTAGLVISLLFTLLPLLAVRRVSPLLAIRSAQGEATGPDPARLALFFIIAAAVLGFAVLQTGHWTTGLAFTLMMAVSFGTLALVATLVAWSARRFVPRKPLPYVWRQGLANLHRPNNRTVLLLLSLGLGTFLMLTLVLTRATLLAKILGVGGGERPNLMFFDVQDDQAARIAEILKEKHAPVLAQAPLVTMKLSALNGRPVEDVLNDSKSGIPAWALRREYRSTYRGEVTGTEKITAGRFIGRVPPGEQRVPVSVEESLAKDLQLKLNDELTFDVQGVPVTVFLASLRKVEFQRMQPNFFIVFPEGVLEAAPKTFILAVRASSPAESAHLQQAVAKEFPGVSSIDLAIILQTFEKILSKVAFVITFMAAFTVVTGIIVLAGAILTGRYQRIRESVLLRTLGATRRQLRQIQLVEYAVLGGLAALTGGALAVLANGLLARFMFKTDMVLSPVVLLGSVAAGVAFTIVTGLITNRGVANHPPLEVLRQET
ncbi:MAG: FtsX-like permease family protein [Opitutaceae bacterium]|nr:FtsX-like permease family protein [Opitutaceae bacterium]